MDMNFQVFLYLLVCWTDTEAALTDDRRLHRDAYNDPAWSGVDSCLDAVCDRDHWLEQKEDSD